MLIDERRQLIERLTLLPARIAEAVKRAEGKPQPEDAWSLRTIVVHLIACEREIWQSRLQQMAAEDNPQWKWTQPDNAEWDSYHARHSLHQLRYVFALIRQETVNHLRRLADDGWKRIGTHATYGQMDVAGLCREILKHDEEHLADLLKRGE